MRPILSAILTAAGLIFGGLALPATAQTQIYVSPGSQVHIRAGAQLHAGPGVEYPGVEYVRFSATAHLHGCLSHYEWCDVSTSTSRGWVPAYALAVLQNQRFYDFTQSRNWYAYPIITFVFDRYWHDHYRSRDWYRDRHRYRHHHGGNRDNRPGVDPRFRDGTWDRSRVRDGRRDDRQRRDREIRPRQDDNRDYRGFPRRVDQENRDYRGMPRWRDRVGNPPRGPDIPPPDVRRPRPDMPSPDLRRPEPVAPPQNRPRDRESDRPAPPRRGQPERGRQSGEAVRVE